MKYLVTPLSVSAVDRRSTAAKARGSRLLVPMTDDPRGDSPGCPDVLVPVEAEGTLR